MEYFGLRIDPAHVAMPFVAPCKKSVCSPEKGVFCGVCRERERLVELTYSVKYPSVVMHGTRLYEMYVQSGPAPYYMVVAGYLAINCALSQLCGVGSDLIKDNNWNERALPARKQVAARVAVYRQRVADACENASNPLQFLQALELQIIIQLAAMRETEVFEPRPFTEAALNADIEAFTTRSIKLWDYDRCGADDLPGKVQANHLWNAQWRTRQLMKSVRNH